ncbi:hypothetical protein Pan44_09070 [Caulifigura coniformis]|uniref:Uncharacterized protein n=1 Tax=Caulifigura coniformis TaxID=2527983 RepID=A0A517S9T9_9PLAN|nr:hypothetical protein Pan44_09070 [Caulifigura coniformis]
MVTGNLSHTISRERVFRTGHATGVRRAPSQDLQGRRGEKYGTTLTRALLGRPDPSGGRRGRAAV